MFSTCDDIYEDLLLNNSHRTQEEVSYTEVCVPLAEYPEVSILKSPF